MSENNNNNPEYIIDMGTFQFLGVESSSEECEQETVEYYITLNEQGPQGRDGEKGEDGFSPEISVIEDTEDSYKLSILTKEGQFNTPNLKGPQGEQGEPGEDGQDGQDGADGEDGFSPIVTVTQTETGATISITDAEGTTTADILNGEEGPQGEQGEQGEQGVSVTGVTLISTVGLDKTYRMTFSNGTHFDYVVSNGASGSTQWGGILGTLSNQTDLQNALNDKYDANNPDGFITATDSVITNLQDDVTDNTTAINNLSTSKQDTLVSGTNIKTINGSSILGSGDLEIGGNVDDVKVDGTSVVTNKVANIDLSKKENKLTAVNPINIYDTQVSASHNCTISSNTITSNYSTWYGWVGTSNRPLIYHNITDVASANQSYIDVPFNSNYLYKSNRQDGAPGGVIFGYYDSSDLFVPVAYFAVSSSLMLKVLNIDASGYTSDGTNIIYNDPVDTAVSLSLISGSGAYCQLYKNANGTYTVSKGNANGHSSSTTQVGSISNALLDKITTVRIASYQMTTGLSTDSIKMFDINGVASSVVSDWSTIDSDFTNILDLNSVTTYHNITTKYDNNTIKVNANGELYADIESGGMPIGTIYPVVCTDDYVPDGALPCDGTEYSKSQFNDLWTNYLTGATPLLNTCSYSDYASDIATYGSCAKFGIDTVNNKFKVPTIKDGQYITQALSDTELGKSYNESLPNIKGEVSLGGNNTYGLINSDGPLFTGVFKQGTSKPYGSDGQPAISAYALGFDASGSSSTYQDNAKVQGNNVRLRYFVQVATGQINQSMMDWAAWASSLQGKLNTDVSTNITTDGKSYVSGLGAASTTRYTSLTFGASGTEYTAPANGYFSALGTKSGSVGQILLHVKGNDHIQTSRYVPISNSFGITTPLLKAGTVVVLAYDGGVTGGRVTFIYAEGEQ